VVHDVGLEVGLVLLSKVLWLSPVELVTRLRELIFSIRLRIKRLKMFLVRVRLVIRPWIPFYIGSM